MPGETVTLSAGLDLSRAEQQLRNFAARHGEFNLRLNTRGISEPLGHISRQANEFRKSMDAAQARVISFGLAVGSIYVFQRALGDMTKAAINTEKSLADINVILNLNKTNLQNFGRGLVDVAKNTAQSFKVVSTAALELSRQGLGIEQTLKRTNAALILTRLSGLDVAASVETITAAINSFSRQTLDAIQVVSKFAAVDQAFAVSSRDLAEAVSRVGSTAQDAGVDLDKLIGIVTAVQQTTSRGGAVIGNALKTIFTRLERTDTIDQLRSLGVEINNSQNGIQKLVALSQALQTADRGQAALIKEFAGGVFQINVVSAALADLSKQYSTYASATGIANRATDEAITRNEQLNQTVSALVSKAGTNLLKLGSDLGGAAFGDRVSGFLKNINKALESIDVNDSSNIGGVIGRGVVEGLAKFLTGPGALIVLGGLVKLFGRLATFSRDALKDLIGLNEAGHQRALIEQAVSNVLQQQVGLQEGILKGTISIAEAEAGVLAILRQQIATREALIGVSGGIAATAFAGGIRPKGEFLTQRRIPALAQAFDYGTIPSLSNAIVRESSVVSSSLVRVGADNRLRSSANPLGVGVYNTKDEPMGLGQGISRSLSLGINPKNHGIPNFVDTGFTSRTFGTSFLDKFLTPEIQKLRELILTNKSSFNQLADSVKNLAKQFDLTNQSVNRINQKLQFTESQRTGTAQTSLGAALLRGGPGNELTRTGISRDQLQRLTPQQAAALGAGSIPIGPDRLLGPPNTGFTFFQPARGAGENLLGLRPPVGLLQEGKVFESGFPARTRLPDESSRLEDTLRQGRIRQLIEEQRRNAEEARITTERAKRIQAATDREFIEQSRNRGVGLFGSRINRRLEGIISQRGETAAEAQGLLSQRQQIGQSQRFSVGLITSIAAPIISSTIDAQLDKNTRTGRLQSAGVNALSSAVSFGALGSILTKGPQGLIGGLAIGGGLGIANILKEINNQLPDFETKLKDSAEALSNTSDSLSRFIQNTDKLKQVFGGELKVNPQQLLELRGEQRRILGDLNLSQRELLTKGLTENNLLGAVNQINIQNDTTKRLNEIAVELIKSRQEKTPINALPAARSIFNIGFGEKVNDPQLQERLRRKFEEIQLEDLVGKGGASEFNPQGLPEVIKKQNLKPILDILSLSDLPLESQQNLISAIKTFEGEKGKNIDPLQQFINGLKESFLQSQKLSKAQDELSKILLQNADQFKATRLTLSRLQFNLERSDILSKFSNQAEGANIRFRSDRLQNLGGGFSDLIRQTTSPISVSSFENLLKQNQLDERFNESQNTARGAFGGKVSGVARKIVDTLSSNTTSRTADIYDFLRSPDLNKFTQFSEQLAQGGTSQELNTLITNFIASLQQEGKFGEALGNENVVNLIQNSIDEISKANLEFTETQKANLKELQDAKTILADQLKIERAVFDQQKRINFGGGIAANLDPNSTILRILQARQNIAEGNFSGNRFQTVGGQFELEKILDTFGVHGKFRTEIEAGIQDGFNKVSEVLGIPRAVNASEIRRNQYDAQFLPEKLPETLNKGFEIFSNLLTGRNIPLVASLDNLKGSIDILIDIYKEIKILDSRLISGGVLEGAPSIAGLTSGGGGFTSNFPESFYSKLAQTDGIRALNKVLAPITSAVGISSGAYFTSAPENFRNFRSLGVQRSTSISPMFPFDVLPQGINDPLTRGTGFNRQLNINDFQPVNIDTTKISERLQFTQRAGIDEVVQVVKTLLQGDLKLLNYNDPNSGRLSNIRRSNTLQGPDFDLVQGNLGLLTHGRTSTPFEMEMELADIEKKLRILEFQSVLRKPIKELEQGQYSQFDIEKDFLGDKISAREYQSKLKQLRSGGGDLFNGDLTLIGAQPQRRNQGSFGNLLRGRRAIELGGRFGTVGDQNFEQKLQVGQGILSSFLNNRSIQESEILSERFINQFEEIIDSSDDLTNVFNKLSIAADKIALDFDFSKGRLFSDEFAQINQDLRLKNILATGKASGGDIAGAFVDQFRYTGRDFYKDLALGAEDTAQTIKSAFSDAFRSFRDGTKSAGDAFKEFGLNILNRIADITTNIAFNSLFGGLSNLVSPSLGSIFGGTSKTAAASATARNYNSELNLYSAGGLVTGGSGIYDDVPANLDSGDFVVNKRAVQLYGAQNILRLNDPGALQTSDVSTSGRGINARFANAFAYNDAQRPTGGYFNLDPRLSTVALTDENNPQNRLRGERELGLLSYIADKKAYDEENQRILENFRRGQSQRRLAGYISAATSLFGAGLGSLGGSGGSGGGGKTPAGREIGSGYRANVGYASGGIRGNDSIPAYLTAGEVVINKDVVNRTGVGFWNALNRGKIDKRLIRNFDYGGSVGGSSSGDFDGITDAVNKLNESALLLKDNLTQGRGATIQNQTSPSQVNNISVSIQIDRNDKVTERTEQNTNGQKDANNRQSDIKVNSELLKNAILKVILEQLKPNGLIKEAIG